VQSSLSEPPFVPGASASSPPPSPSPQEEAGPSDADNGTTLALAQLARGPEAVWTALDQHRILAAVETLEEAVSAHESLQGSQEGAAVVRSAGNALEGLRPQIRQAAYRCLQPPHPATVHMYGNNHESPRFYSNSG